MASITIKWNSISDNVIFMANEDKLFLSNVKEWIEISMDIGCIRRKRFCYNIVKTKIKYMLNMRIFSGRNTCQ